MVVVAFGGDNIPTSRQAVRVLYLRDQPVPWLQYERRMTTKIGLLVELLLAQYLAYKVSYFNVRYVLA